MAAVGQWGWWWLEGGGVEAGGKLGVGCLAAAPALLRMCMCKCEMLCGELSRSLAPNRSRHVHPGLLCPLAAQARHLETVQRTATQNAVACKLLAATAVKSAAAAAAAAGGGAEQQQQQQSPPFKVGFDFKAALASSGGSFYPVIKLSH